MSLLKPERLSAKISRKTVWQLTKIGLAVGLAALIIAQTRPADLRALLQRVHLAWLGISFVFFWGLLGFTTLRYWLLIGRQVTLPNLFSVIILQNAISNFLAGSAGAASYVAMLKGEHQIKMTQSLASLVLARAGDLLAVWVALALSSWVLWEQIAPLRWLVLLLLVSIAGGLLALALTIALRHTFVEAIRRLMTRFHLHGNPFCQRGLQILTTLADQEPRAWSPLLEPAMLYGGLILVTTIGWAYCNTRALAIPLGLWPIVFMVSLTQLMAIIPIQVFGGLGVYDVTTMYLYGLFGITQPLVAPAVIGGRLIFYGMNLLTLLYLPLEGRLRNENQITYPNGLREVGDWRLEIGDSS